MSKKTIGIDNYLKYQEIKTDLKEYEKTSTDEMEKHIINNSIKAIEWFLHNQSRRTETQKLEKLFIIEKFTNPSSPILKEILRLINNEQILTKEEMKENIDAIFNIITGAKRVPKTKIINRIDLDERSIKILFRKEFLQTKKNMLELMYNYVVLQSSDLEFPLTKEGETDYRKEIIESAFPQIKYKNISVATLIENNMENITNDQIERFLILLHLKKYSKTIAQEKDFLRITNALNTLTPIGLSHLNDKIYSGELQNYNIRVIETYSIVEPLYEKKKCSKAEMKELTKLLNNLNEIEFKYARNIFYKNNNLSKNKFMKELTKKITDKKRQARNIRHIIEKTIKTTNEVKLYSLIYQLEEKFGKESVYKEHSIVYDKPIDTQKLSIKMEELVELTVPSKNNRVINYDRENEYDGIIFDVQLNANIKGATKKKQKIASFCIVSNKFDK